MDKKRVYVFQINTPTDRNLLPLAAGLIVSYSKNIYELSREFSFEIEILRTDPRVTVDSVEEPTVLGFSCYSWNIRQHIEIAKLIKKRWPESTIVFGGPSCPRTDDEVREFIRDNQCVDIMVNGEGELPFAEILFAKLEGKTWDHIPGITYLMRDAACGFVKTPPRLEPVLLDLLPSPFLDGTFEQLLKRHENSVITGALWETNRGCPFSCTFCYWGQVQKSKIRTFEMDRLTAELNWISKNRIGYVYTADANFGILDRDVSIAERVTEISGRTGYPRYFMVNWTKHRAERIFEIAKILRSGGIGFNVTLSVQSLNPDTLKAVRRQNMPFDDIIRTVRRANRENISVYSDLILGLPNESYRSFIDGLEKVFQPYISYYFSIYLCRVLTGSEMNYSGYRTSYNIETRRCLVEMGRRETVRAGVSEYEELIVSTSTLSLNEWHKLYFFCYMAVPFYNYRLLFFVLNYLKYQCHVKITEVISYIIEQMSGSSSYPTLTKAAAIVEDVRDSILSNGSSVTRFPKTGNIVWEPYEAALLQLLSDLKNFYREVFEILTLFIKEKQVKVERDVWREVFAYQIAAIPTWENLGEICLAFTHAIPQWFQALCQAGQDPDNLSLEAAAPALATFKEIISMDSDILSFVKSHLKGGTTFVIRKVEIVDHGKVIPHKNAEEYLRDILTI